MNDTQIIRNRHGRIVLRITTEPNGNKIVRDFYGRVVGRYDKKNNVTRDFYGRIVARGDNCGMFATIE